MKTIFTLILALTIQTSVFSQVNSFTGQVKNDRVDLKWETSTENNISHFIIEKSTDGVNYSQAGLVFAFGNSVEPMRYPFFEKGVKVNAAASIYYRLAVVTNAGVVTSTQVTKVTNEMKYDKAVGTIK